MKYSYQCFQYANATNDNQQLGLSGRELLVGSWGVCTAICVVVNLPSG